MLKGLCFFSELSWLKQSNLLLCSRSFVSAFQLLCSNCEVPNGQTFSWLVFRSPWWEQDISGFYYTFLENVKESEFMWDLLRCSCLFGRHWKSIYRWETIRCFKCKFDRIFISKITRAFMFNENMSLKRKKFWKLLEKVYIFVII